MSESDLRAAQKLRRYITWLGNLDKKFNKDIMSRTSVVINKGSFAAGDGTIDGVRVAGSVPKYGDNNINGIASAISRLALCEIIRSR